MTRIAVLVRHFGAAEHRFLEGVSEYARTQPGWTLHLDFLRANVLRSLNQRGVEALILHSRQINSLVSRLAQQLGVPTVRAGAIGARRAGYPCLGFDHQSIGAMAAEHLSQSGFTHVAFVQAADDRADAAQWRGFAQQVNSEIRLRLIRLHPTQNGDMLVEEVEGASSRRLPLGDWLAAAPRPTGIYVRDNMLARHLSHACHDVRLMVPDEIGILTSGNDPAVCELTSPALSSIELPDTQLGREAAAIVRAMLDGDPIETSQWYPPVRVCVRRSTEVVASQHPELALALQFIRDHADQNITVQDVLDILPISRRKLEKLFRKHLDRSPLEEIHCVKGSRVRRLLIETDLSIEQIVVQHGFSDRKHLTAVFKQVTGYTPAAFRRAFRKLGRHPPAAGWEAVPRPSG